MIHRVEEQVMAWRRRYLFGPFWQEFDDFMADMETQFNEMLEELATTKALPGKEMRARMLPAIRGEFRVDVKEHDDEVIVAADLPGVEKDDVSLEVIDPQTLRIAFSREAESKEEAEGKLAESEAARTATEEQKRSQTDPLGTWLRGVVAWLRGLVS